MMLARPLPPAVGLSTCFQAVGVTANKAAARARGGQPRDEDEDRRDEDRSLARAPGRADQADGKRQGGHDAGREVVRIPDPAAETSLLLGDRLRRRAVAAD